MADIEDLKEKRKSLTARIRKAQKAAADAKKAAVEKVELDLGRWVLGLAFEASETRTVDERAKAVKSALGQQEVSDILRSLVRQDAPAAQHSDGGQNDDHQA